MLFRSLLAYRSGNAQSKRDVLSTLKPLHGRQEGAEMGYNPSKPKRPSHVPHTFEPPSS